jgi:hypothetical protein
MYITRTEKQVRVSVACKIVFINAGCNNAMYIIRRIKEIQGFFHDAG